MHRRDFLWTGAAAASLLALPARGQPPDRLGEVLRLDRPGLAHDAHSVDVAKAAAALDAALMAFAGAASPGAAMARFVSRDDRVALKVNALAAPGHVFPPALAQHVARRVIEAGVPAERVVIYDQYPSRMRKAGYVFTTAPGAVRCVCHRLVGFGARAVPYADGKNALKWSRALLDATAVLNLMVPKDHDLAGVTGALKNLAFGSVDHVPEFHADIQRAIPWVYAQPEIRDKVRLCLCDASRVTYDGGPHDKPKTRAVCDAVLVAEDGVAMDWAVLELVNAERARRGLLGVERDARRRPDWLHNAANMALGARFADLRWRRIDDAGRASAWAPAHIDKAFSAGDPGPPRGG